MCIKIESKLSLFFLWDNEETRLANYTPGFLSQFRELRRTQNPPPEEEEEEKREKWMPGIPE